MAYRKGFIRAATLAACVVALISGFAWTAAKRSYEARNYAMLATREAQHARAEARSALANLYAADMGLAQQAWADKNFGRLRELLDEFRVPAGQTDLRNFEWYQFWWRGHFDLPFRPNPTAYVCESVVFSTDGTMLRSNDGHGVITYWDARTGQILPGPADKTFDGRFTGTASRQAAMASPDGRYRATGTHFDGPEAGAAPDPKSESEFRNATVALRDLRTGVTHVLHGAMASFVFSPDSRVLATESPDDDIKLWDTATGRQIGVLYGGRAPLAYSPDGARLAAGSYAYGWGIKLFDTSKTREPLSLAGTADAVAVASEGDLVATLDANWSGVTLREELTQRVLRRLPGATLPLALTPNGKMLATGMKGANDRVVLWDTATGKEIVRFQAASAGGVNELMGATFSNDGRWLAACTFGGGVTLWDVTARRMVRSLPANGMPAFSPDSRLMAVPTGDGPVQSRQQCVMLYNVTSGSVERTLPGAHAPVAFSPIRITAGPDAPAAFRAALPLWLVAGGPKNRLELWDGATGTRTGTIYQGFRYAVQTCVFSGDGARLVAGDSGEYKVIMWDVATGRETFHIPGRTDRTDVASYTLAFSPDGWRLYSGNQDGKIKVWGHGR